MSQTETRLPADANDLTTGSIAKKLLGFFWPILLGLLFQQLYSTVDAAIVGRYLGASALAAVGGSASVITNTVIGFCTGLNSGASVIISQYYGAGDGKGLARVLHTFISFCLIIGVAVTVLLCTLAPAFLRLVNTPEDIMAESTVYLRIYFLGAIPMLLYNLFQGTLQAVGNSKKPLKYLIVSCILNIVLDILFVAVFGLGVGGAAAASALSMAVCAGMAYLYLRKVDGPHRIELKKLCLDMPMLKRTLRIGLPAGLEGCMYNISNLIIQACVNGFGTSLAASWTATSKLDGFYWVTTTAFGVAICAFVGQCYGAGDHDRMRRSVRTCMKISIGVTLMISAVLLLISRWAYSVILSDSVVIDNACSIMYCFVPFYVIWSYVEVLTGAFRGTGDTLRPMIITMIGTCFLRIAWIYLVLPSYNDIHAVGIVYPVTWFITGAAFTVYFLKYSAFGKKRSKQLNR